MEEKNTLYTLGLATEILPPSSYSPIASHHDHSRTRHNLSSLLQSSFKSLLSFMLAFED